MTSVFTKEEITCEEPEKIGRNIPERERGLRTVVRIQIFRLGKIVEVMAGNGDFCQLPKLKCVTRNIGCDQHFRICDSDTRA